MTPHLQKADLLVVVDFSWLAVDFANAHAFATIAHELTKFTNAEIGDLMHTNQ